MTWTKPYKMTSFKIIVIYILVFLCAGVQKFSNLLARKAQPNEAMASINKLCNLMRMYGRTRTCLQSFNCGCWQSSIGTFMLCPH